MQGDKGSNVSIGQLANTLKMDHDAPVKDIVKDFLAPLTTMDLGCYSPKLSCHADFAEGAARRPTVSGLRPNTDESCELLIAEASTMLLMMKRLMAWSLATSTPKYSL